MANDRWIEKWAVRSSSGNGDYIVGKDAEGKYGCSCPGWTRHVYCPYCHTTVKKGDTDCVCCGRTMISAVRHDCQHISTVKGGGGRSIAEAVLDRMKGR